MKYPLTIGTKAAARYIVSAWDTEKLEQELTITVLRGDDEVQPGFVFGASDDFESPPFAAWRELAKFDLVDIRRDDDAWKILLLQELRNAVATDFDVSDYFITMNAVGNIIVNSTTGPVQGVGVNTGTVHQTVEQLADYMSATLGQEFLAANAELRAAIDELRVAVGGNQHSKLGKVISELGNCLQHGANAATLTAALVAAAPLLQRLVGG
jgi:hypothetical protein